MLQFFYLAITENSIIDHVNVVLAPISVGVVTLLVNYYQLASLNGKTLLTILPCFIH